MPQLSTTHNQIEYSVSDVSNALKRVVEDAFGLVRVRGEITGWKAAASGHVYFSLKDDNSVMDSVCWKGTASRFTFKPEDGLEVICTGKITTYGGRSKYQMIVERMEPAGAGALMALLEQRKKQLAAEGLFAPERKRQLPFLPQVIGVVTSPTGAVIRDILHRVQDRFPVHILVWPVLVQGENAAEQIAGAIRGFNIGGNFPKPDVLIVARGGGSIEDLWAFNEEIVVRAAAESAIPLISAVGHETDTTLIDYASDRRAPTPTAAAEIALPVRDEWLFTIQEMGARMGRATSLALSKRAEALEARARLLPRLPQILEQGAQRLDDWSERLSGCLPNLLALKQERLTRYTPSLASLTRLLTQQEQEVSKLSARLASAFPAMLVRKEDRLARFIPSPALLLRGVERHGQDLPKLGERLQQAYIRGLADRLKQVIQQTRMLESLNYNNIIKRGFAVIKSDAGVVLTSVQQTQTGQSVELHFKDGMRTATIA